MSEQTSNKVLASFIAGAVMLSVFSYLFKSLDIPLTYRSTHTVVLILTLVFSAAFICCAVFYAVQKKKGSFSAEKVLNPVFLGIMFLVCALCSLFLYVNYFLAMKAIYVIIPAIVIYYLVYNVYQRSFFYLLLTHGVIALLIYFIAHTESTLYKCVAAAVAAVVCVIAVIVVKASDKKGTVSVCGKKISVFEYNLIPSAKAVYLIYGITLAIVIACVFIPSFIVTYVFYAVAVFLLCCAVYYTIRLM